MEKKLLIPTTEVQLAVTAILPPSWQLNERQIRFIEDLWLPDEHAAVAASLTDNLTPPG